jgi:hypothetical protein
MTSSSFQAAIEQSIQKELLRVGLVTRRVRSAAAAIVVKKTSAKNEQGMLGVGDSRKRRWQSQTTRIIPLDPPLSMICSEPFFLDADATLPPSSCTDIALAGNLTITVIAKHQPCKVRLRLAVFVDIFCLAL